MMFLVKFTDFLVIQCFSVFQETDSDQFYSTQQIQEVSSGFKDSECGHMFK